MLDSAADTPTEVPPEMVRAVLERISASEIFQPSPQLVAFLRFVVDAVLHGRSGSIKGYTIGVEVLRRDATFDPQIDPIVRVEATRLRRALERYYAGPGATDDLIIDLPRGSYVPVFRRRTDISVEYPAETSEKRPADEPKPHRWTQYRSWFAASLFLLLSLTAAVVSVVLLRAGGTPAPETAALPQGRTMPASNTESLPSGNGMPTTGSREC